MAGNPFDPTQWASGLQKMQSDVMGQWSQWNALWSPGMAATAGVGAAEAPRTAAGAAAAPFAQQLEQFLGISRSLWELLGRSASIPDGAERVRAFNEGLGGLQQQFASMFSMPMLGPARAQQAVWQRAAAAGTRCAQAQSKLAALWNDVVAQGLRELGQQLAPGLQAGRTPGSLKEVYDSWVNAAESSYARAAQGATYIQAQAEFSNALAELRIAQREILEDWARQFDLPTRAELNTLHQQVRELTAAVKRLGG